MQNPPIDTNSQPGVGVASAVDRLVGDPASVGNFDAYARPGVRVGENLMTVRDRVQWGPIAAGTITSLVTLLVLTVLGLAIGASAFEPGTDASDWGTAAGIWGGTSAIAAFFLGGWVAARTAAVGGRFAGMMNGLMAGAATLLLLLWLTTTGVTNFLGFLGNNIADIAAVASDTVQTASPANAEDAQNAATDARWRRGPGARWSRSSWPLAPPYSGAWSATTNGAT
jgi:hypothetical protein